MFPQKIDPRLSAWALSACLLLCAPASIAEVADRDQPINLEADQVTVDEASRVSTFTGTVRLQQGSLLIRGDTVVVEQDKDGFVQATAHGKTASFRQKREAAEGYVEGYGERIHYDAKAEMLYLDTQARLKRDRDEVTGEHITYNARTELFQVNANGVATDIKQQKRVRVVLQPKSKQDAADTRAPAPPPSKQGTKQPPESK